MRFFTSDMHFGHARIIELANRPFETVDEMNQTLIRRWNSVVHPDDTVYVVGDGWMGKRVETLPLARQLNGYILLIPGNHDDVHLMSPRHLRMYPVFAENGITTISEQIRLVIGGEQVEVCHFPYTGDSHDEDRYVEWRPTDEGRPLICGHVHEAWKRKDNMLNVGVDVWDFTPVSEDQVREALGL